MIMTIAHAKTVPKDWVCDLSVWFFVLQDMSEAWGPPQIQEKRSRSEKAILAALGEFRHILGAALEI